MTAKSASGRRVQHKNYMYIQQLVLIAHLLDFRLVGIIKQLILQLQGMEIQLYYKEEIR